MSENKDECNMYPLRALFFAYDDEDQIVQLVIETFQGLPTTTGDNKTAKELWENIYAFMADAVGKYLKVEDEISKQLNAEHIPIHLLCKSHTCQKLDESCTNTLVKVEHKLKMSEIISQRQPSLRSFIWKSKSVVLCTMTALLKLVSHEESAKSTSLAKEFDIILEEDNVTKLFSLYKERRFTKLGYTAGSIVDCMSQFNKLLAQTTYDTVPVQACRVYLENKYIIAAMKALSYFTYKVTMPFLNCVEKCDQNGLTQMYVQFTSCVYWNRMYITNQCIKINV